MKCEEIRLCLESRRTIIQVATVPVFELYNKSMGELNIATKCASIMTVLDEQRSGGDTFCGFVLMCVL